MTNPVEDNQRSQMIVSMEKTLNAGWFARRTEKDRLCTLSTSQYWDLITYIDVSYRQGVMIANNVFLFRAG